MLVKCVKNNIKDITGDFEVMKEINYDIRTEGGIVNLEIGKLYQVYAVEFRKINRPIYYICDENYIDYPMWYYASFFEVFDARLSKYWEFGYNIKTITSSEIVDCWESFFSFKEWVCDNQFHLSVVDGRKKEQEIFQKYKKLIDEEFPIPVS